MKKQILAGGVAIIKKGNKYLLIQESDDKPGRGRWRLPGGRFEKLESAGEGLRREIKEEVNLDIELTNNKPVVIAKSDYFNHYFGFFETKLLGGRLKINTKEAKKAGWFSLQQIKKMDLVNATKNFFKSYYD